MLLLGVSAESRESLDVDEYISAFSNDPDIFEYDYRK
jgi:hypothetical protein